MSGFTPAPAPAPASVSIYNLGDETTSVSPSGYTPSGYTPAGYDSVPVYNITNVTNITNASNVLDVSKQDVFWMPNTYYLLDDVVLYINPSQPKTIYRYRCITEHKSSDDITPLNTTHWVIIDTPLIFLFNTIVVQIIIPFAIISVLVNMFLPSYNKTTNNIIKWISICMVITSVLFVFVNLLTRNANSVYFYTSEFNAMLHAGVGVIFALIAALSGNTETY